MGITSKKSGAFFELNEEKDVWELTDILLRNTVLISRKDLFSSVVELSEFLVFELTATEEADILEWSRQTIKQVVEDEFIRCGLTWREAERWIASCYRMRLNPLSTLRVMLNEHAVPVYYARRGYDASTIGLLCIEIGESSVPSSSRVILVANGTLEALAQDRAERKRILKASGVR